MNIKGIFASDIDGTLTDRNHLIPDEVVNYLIDLHHADWKIVFLTGRTYSFAQMSMEKMNIPYVLGVQNGAEVLSMPESKLINQNFLTRDILSDLDEIFKGHTVGYIIYSGFEHGDFCYFKPEEFSDEVLSYLGKLKRFSSVKWRTLDSWDEFDADTFPLVKCFGPREELDQICKKVVEKLALHATVIRDAVDPSKGILMITGDGVDKGTTLKKLCKDQGWNAPIVAAGDDNNDRTLLEMADVSICVSGGNKELESLADIVAVPSKELGIIKALDQAFERGLISK